MKPMMEDPRMGPTPPGNPPMPFDGERVIFGGFEPVVEVTTCAPLQRHHGAPKSLFAAALSQAAS